jgi:predicted DNA-binding antitoxin AbrB/MazE fold protein
MVTGCHGSLPWNAAQPSNTITQTTPLSGGSASQEEHLVAGSTPPPGPLDEGPSGVQQVSQAAAIGFSDALPKLPPEADPNRTPQYNPLQQPSKPFGPMAPTSVATETAAPVDRQQAMADVLGPLQEIGAIDPGAQQLLMAEMKKTNPEQWPMMAQQFRAAMAFRKQLEQRESRTTRTDNTAHAPTTQSHGANKVPQTDRPPGLGTANPNRQASPQLASSASTTPIHSDNRANELRQITSEVVHLDPPPVGQNNAGMGPKHFSPASMPDTPASVASDFGPNRPSQLAAQIVSYSSSSQGRQELSKMDHAIQARAGTGPEESSSSSQQQLLDQVVAAMEQSVPDQPASIEDIHEHMRLRLQYLIAGQQENALRSIPGATPTQQDYWSKQLFSIATFLDHQTQPNSKRRAAAALMHLDEARGTLAELATLNVRNYAFVESVDGFGVYKPLKKAAFKPGEQVTLYAEVENFRSQSTEKGYRTLLGTSYQIVNKNGKRVDGSQFPEVLDHCKSRRRDFHIQYGITLPTRIFPDSYELQLIVTDNLTGKIGQVTLAFEITEQE